MGGVEGSGGSGWMLLPAQRARLGERPTAVSSPPGDRLRAERLRAGRDARRRPAVHIVDLDVAAASDWSDYEVTGRMMVPRLAHRLGTLLYSQIPQGEGAIGLIRTSWYGSYRIAVLGVPGARCEGMPRTGVVPTARALTRARRPRARSRSGRGGEARSTGTTWSFGRSDGRRAARRAHETARFSWARRRRNPFRIGLLLAFRQEVVEVLAVLAVEDLPGVGGAGGVEELLLEGRVDADRAGEGCEHLQVPVALFG